jgi:hypothetical protein
MNRQEALAVLHEINNECKETILATCVSLEASSSLTKDGKGYQIRMKCDLDDYSLKSLKPILQRNSLVLEENNGFAIIFKPNKTQQLKF